MSIRGRGAERSDEEWRRGEERRAESGANKRLKKKRMSKNVSNSITDLENAEGGNKKRKKKKERKRYVG